MPRTARPAGTDCRLLFGLQVRPSQLEFVATLQRLPVTPASAWCVLFLYVLVVSVVLFGCAFVAELGAADTACSFSAHSLPKST